MEYKYLIKEPNSCSEHEIHKFYDLVVKGGKVKLEGLRERILNCKLLAFCYNTSNEIIAISSIKKPQKSYITKVIKNANLDRLHTDLQFELGYSFTDVEYRRKGINGNLKAHLLDAIKVEDCLVFSTTAITSSQIFLENNGFICYGKSYDGENDRDIKYYEKRFGKI
ncbi:hypothetical protein [Flavobacterium sp. A45]|uniref:hypothetical protein n=1 Tax=Flavobacterium sp. A45 TaxID=1945862 RepID=UPI000985DAEE|nr:hypothetical protein [Flavobacterium sp. A45]OOG78980.1 hypothetical protein B0E44_00175 [Flavobacterium sp. A45]